MIDSDDNEERRALASEQEIKSLHEADVGALTDKVQRLIDEGSISFVQAGVISEIWRTVTSDRYTPQMLSINGPEVFTRATVNLKPIDEPDEQRERIIGAVPEEIKEEFINCAVDEVYLVPHDDRSPLLFRIRDEH